MWRCRDDTFQPVMISDAYAEAEIGKKWQVQFEHVHPGSG